MGRLTVRYRVRRFLKADNLAIGKFGAIVNERHGTDASTCFSRAARGFFNPPTVDLYLDGMRTVQATKEGRLHIRDNGCGTDDETFDCDEFVGI